MSGTKRHRPGNSSHSHSIFDKRPESDRQGPFSRSLPSTRPTPANATGLKPPSRSVTAKSLESDGNDDYNDASGDDDNQDRGKGGNESEDEDDYMSMVIEEPKQKKIETSLQRQRRMRVEAEIRAHPKSASQLAAESHAQAFVALRKPAASLPADNRGFKLLSKLGYTPGTSLGKDQSGAVTRPIGINVLEDGDELDPQEARKRRRIGIGYEVEQQRRMKDAARSRRREGGDDGNGGDSNDDGDSGSSSDNNDDDSGDDDDDDDEFEDTPQQDLGSKTGRLAARRTRKAVRTRYRDRLRSEHEEKRTEGIIHAAQRIAEQISTDADGAAVVADAETQDQDQPSSSSSSSSPPPLRSINVLWRAMVRDRRAATLAEAEEADRLRRMLSRPDQSAGLTGLASSLSFSSHPRKAGIFDHDGDSSSDSGSGDESGLEAKDDDDDGGGDGDTCNPQPEHAYFSTVSHDQAVAEECPKDDGGGRVGALPTIDGAEKEGQESTTTATADPSTGNGANTMLLQDAGPGGQPPDNDNDNDDDDDDDPDADPELAEFEALPPSERLAKILSFLRDTYHYCFWCKFRYPSVDEMNADGGCPGEDEDVHG